MDGHLQSHIEPEEHTEGLVGMNYAGLVLQQSIIKHWLEVKNKEWLMDEKKGKTENAVLSRAW